MTTRGYAEVELDEAGFRATLRYHAESGGIYHCVEATIGSDNDVDAVVRSPNPDTAEPGARALFAQGQLRLSGQAPGFY